MFVQFVVNILECKKKKKKKKKERKRIFSFRILFGQNRDMLGWDLMQNYWIIGLFIHA